MQEVERYNPSIDKGLNEKQIEERKQARLVNYDTTVPTKSIKSIVISNVFTIFNLLNLVLAIAVFFTGSYRNLLFLIIVICNTVISTYQEIHSKRVIDKLAVVSATKTTAIRSGKEEKIGINDLVLDDIIKLSAGNQIVTDCIICDGEAEVNESFITGESDTVHKEKGDMLLSGSFISKGNVIAKVEHIGNDNFTAKIGTEAKQIKKAKSEIMTSLNKVIKTVSVLIFPVGALLLYNQINVMEASLNQAILQTVAALIGMIPEGLVLLTSTVLAVSVVRLSKSKVLVQELYCIETLARVDVLCLDKTGTITIGTPEARDEVRKEAKQTLQYFKEQGVEIKIISGDDPIKVSEIAKKAGVEHFDKYIDMSKVSEDELKQVVSEYTVFAKVSPTQKRDIVKAIKENGHTVAMTGDGVNDVLALKEADCSIAIASGSDAARNVSQLVLLDSNFSSMPKIVAEGRRTINNIERSSELFLTKTIYATILAILFVFISMPYPFRPIQFSLISTVTIGIPSFVLALQPNRERVKGNFLRNIFSRALPTSLTVVCNIILVLIFSKIFGLNSDEYSTMCIVLTAITGFTLLVKLCKPFNALRVALCIFVVSLFLTEIIFMKDLFYISVINGKGMLLLAALVAISESLYVLFNYFVKKKLKRYSNAI